jgi:hypothetical protein
MRNDIRHLSRQHTTSQPLDIRHLNREAYDISTVDIRHLNRWHTTSETSFTAEMPFKQGLLATTFSRDEEQAPISRLFSSDNSTLRPAGATGVCLVAARGNQKQNLKGLQAKTKAKPTPEGHHGSC